MVDLAWLWDRTRIIEACKLWKRKEMDQLMTEPDLSKEFKKNAKRVCEDVYNAFIQGARQSDGWVEFVERTIDMIHELDRRKYAVRDIEINVPFVRSVFCKIGWECGWGKCEPCKGIKHQACSYMRLVYGDELEEAFWDTKNSTQIIRAH